MQTTSFLAELIVIGSFGIIWVDPLINIGINYSIFNTSSEGNTLMILALIPLIYFLGVFINFLSDIIFHIFDTLASEKHGGKKRLQKMRIKIILNSPEGANYLYRKRSILRIFRGNTFNVLAFIIIEIIFNIHTRYSILSIIPKGSLIFSMSIIFFVLFWAYIRSLLGYFSIIENMGDMFNAK